jgi:hypothetical protein
MYSSVVAEAIFGGDMGATMVDAIFTKGREETAGTSSAVEVFSGPSRRESRETMAEMQNDVLSKLFESIEMASMSLSDKKHGEPGIREEDGTAEEWETLTNEIVLLEDIRHEIKVAEHHTGVPGATDPLKTLFQAYDRRIKECEEKLDRLLAGYRNRSASCGLFADYYDR